MKDLLRPAVLLAILLACLSQGFSFEQEAEEQRFFEVLENFFKIPPRHDANKIKKSPSPVARPRPRKVKSEPLKNKEHHDERLPSWEERHKDEQKHKPSKMAPWQRDSDQTRWNTHSRETQHEHERMKENPAHNKFQNLVSRLRKPPEKKQPRRKTQRRYRPDKWEKPERKPAKKEYRDAFDEYRDKNGVLVSIPVETLKQYGHFHEPRERGRYERPKHRTDRRPPKTINPARKINFDYSTNVDTEGRVNANFQDKGVKFAAGSYQDQVYSQWYVVTSEGHEYDGDPKELDIIFELANKPNLPSTSDVIPDSLLNSMNTMGTIQHNQNVVTPDSREMVSNTDRYPFSVIGHLDVGCTGTLIGPNHVLTAGHCVYDYDKGFWYNNLDFHRGKDCDPDEGDVYTWKLAITVKGWKEFGYPSYDYAIVVVSASSPRWMTFGWSNSLHMADVQVVGYPNDKEDRCMWDTSCNIGQEWNDLLGYKCDTSSGMSGGPVFK